MGVESEYDEQESVQEDKLISDFEEEVCSCRACSSSVLILSSSFQVADCATDAQAKEQTMEERQLQMKKSMDKGKVCFLMSQCVLILLFRFSYR